MNEVKQALEGIDSGAIRQGEVEQDHVECVQTELFLRFAHPPRPGELKTPGLGLLQIFLNESGICRIVFDQQDTDRNGSLGHRAHFLGGSLTTLNQKLSMD